MKRVAIVGGGIAGLAAGYHLAREGLENVTIFEREPVLSARSSGRNAAIYRPVEADREITALVARSAELLDELMGSRPAWLRRTGLLFVATDPSRIERLAAEALRSGVAVDLLAGRALHDRAPILRGGEARHGALAAVAGELDTHAITTRLARSFRRRGGSIRRGIDIAAIEAPHGRVTAVVTASGERFACEHAVIASGAWAAPLARTCGAEDVELSVLRRHLALLSAVEPMARLTIWDIEREFYFRPESHDVLASPGDAEPTPVPDYCADQRVLRLLLEKAKVVAPAIAQARIRRLWACLRVFAPDRRPIIGMDGQVSGLAWIAGLGGSGMSAGVAAGEVLARCVLGSPAREDHVFSPRRFKRSVNGAPRPPHE